MSFEELSGDVFDIVPGFLFIVIIIFRIVIKHNSCGFVAFLADMFGETADSKSRDCIGNLEDPRRFILEGRAVRAVGGREGEEGL